MPHIIKSCDNCHESFICFMVKQHVWAQLYRRYDSARICLRCFESGLGRTLTADDLMTREEIFECATRCNDFYREALTPLFSANEEQPRKEMPQGASLNQ